MLPDLPRLRQDRRAVDVRIPVDQAEAHEFRLLQPGNEAQHARLLAPFELRLEPDEAVVIARQVVLAQLNGRVRRPARPRIGEADRLHRPESQRVLARGAPSLRSAGSPRRTSPCRSREPSRTRRGRARRRSARTPRASADNSNSRLPHRRRRRRARSEPGSAQSFFVDRSAGKRLPTTPRLRFHLDARNTLPRSMLSASTIGLMAS